MRPDEVTSDETRASYQLQLVAADVSAEDLKDSPSELLANFRPVFDYDLERKIDGPVVGIVQNFVRKIIGIDLVLFVRIANSFNEMSRQCHGRYAEEENCKCDRGALNDSLQRCARCCQTPLNMNRSRDAKFGLASRLLIEWTCSRLIGHSVRGTNQLSDINATAPNQPTACRQALTIAVLSAQWTWTWIASLPCWIHAGEPPPFTKQSPSNVLSPPLRIVFCSALQLPQLERFYCSLPLQTEGSPLLANTFVGAGSGAERFALA